SAMDNNAYLVIDRGSGDHLLIDAADDSPRLRELLAAPAASGRLVGVLTTHRHWDHVGALAAIAEGTGAPVLVGAADADQLPVAADRHLEHGEMLRVGELVLEVIRSEEHTSELQSRFDVVCRLLLEKKK